jgi:hypothetical protein
MEQIPDLLDSNMHNSQSLLTVAMDYTANSEIKSRKETTLCTFFSFSRISRIG